VIYNPNSGKKIDIKTKISKCFAEAKIEVEFYATKGYLDALNHVRTFNIEEYSAIVVSGGDGSIHEVLNGLLRRDDKKKLPLAFIPNGSGNCSAHELSIDSVDEAL
jgi:sphingosine kinase